MGLRAAKKEDVRDALKIVTPEVSKATGQQYILRAKSLLSYAHTLGNTPYVGAAIKVKTDSGHRGATLAKRIVSEVDVALLFRAAPSKTRSRAPRGHLCRRR
jgi:hypothetical protein